VAIADCGLSQWVTACWHDHWFGAVSEAKKSTKYFSERMNGEGFSRYPVAGATDLQMKIRQADKGAISLTLSTVAEV